MAPLLGALVLSGCSSLGGTGDLEYVPGTGNIVQIDADDREDPVQFSGTTLEGEALDVADTRGRVTVVNVWGAWCNPCRAEAPVLAQAADSVDAAFVGIDIRDPSPDNGLAFQRKYGIGYPSIYDEGSETLQSFGSYSPRNTPSTLVLDEQGRVAALISGEVSSAATIEGLVEDASVETQAPTRSEGSSDG